MRSALGRGDALLGRGEPGRGEPRGPVSEGRWEPAGRGEPCGELCGDRPSPFTAIEPLSL